MSVSEEAAEMGIEHATVVDMNGVASVMEMIALCDPKISTDTESSFIEFWSRARNAISSFIAKDTPLLPSETPSVNKDKN
jgi:hypothetical protein